MTKGVFDSFSRAGNHDQPVLAPNDQNDEGGHHNNNAEGNQNNNDAIANVEVEANQNQQPHQLTLDPSGQWYWDYFLGQWFPYYPPQADQQHIYP